MLEWQAASGVRGAERLGGRSGVEWSGVKWSGGYKAISDKTRSKGQGRGEALLPRRPCKLQIASAPLTK